MMNCLAKIRIGVRYTKVRSCSFFICIYVDIFQLDSCNTNIWCQCDSMSHRETWERTWSTYIFKRPRKCPKGALLANGPIRKISLYHVESRWYTNCRLRLFIHSSIRADSSWSRVYPRILTRRYTARGSLTACVYRQLYLAQAIASPSATDRTDGVNEPQQRASISSQPVTLRPRSHGVYPPWSHALRDIPYHSYACTIALAIPRGIVLDPRTLRPPRLTGDDASHEAAMQRLVVAAAAGLVP